LHSFYKNTQKNRDLPKEKNRNRNEDDKIKIIRFVKKQLQAANIDCSFMLSDDLIRIKKPFEEK
jgi:hypothetical protein